MKNGEIPHFEKMLYDNGQLLSLYALAENKHDQSFFANIAHDTANWIMNVMQSPDGGYYSSLDADSEGHEGKYYLWKSSELKAFLTPDEFNIVSNYFGLINPANFEHQWHLHIVEPLVSVASKLNLTMIEANQLWMSAKKKMLDVRHQRIPPACDNKVLTAWNALMIKGMMTAGNKWHEITWIESAQRAIAFIHQSLWVNRRLLASYNDKKAHLPAYLDDYAFLIDALITSLQFSWNSEYFTFSMDLTDTLLTYFSDDIAGGFYFTAKDHEQLLYRPKSMMDDVIPSGNGVAARVLLVLGYLLGNTHYLDAAEKTLHAAWPALMKFPAEHCSLLEALDDLLNPPQIIVIRGKKDDIEHWRDQCKRNNNYVFAIPDDALHLPAALAEKTAKNKTCAYVCQGRECLDVIDNLETLIDTIK